MARLSAANSLAPSLPAKHQSVSELFGVGMEIRMRAHVAAGLLLGGVWLCSPISAQNVDPNLEREVTGVRTELVRSYNELLNYVWTEETQVLVGGKLKSSSSSACGYDKDLNILRTPLDPEQAKPTSRQTSNRPSVRSKGEMQDYIERAISRIRNYA